MDDFELNQFVPDINLASLESGQTFIPKVRHLTIQLSGDVNASFICSVWEGMNGVACFK